MNTLAKAVVQGAACGLMIGVVLLVGGRVWHPATVAAQSKQQAVADVVRARSFEVVDAAGKVTATLGVLPGGTSPALLLWDTAGNLRVTLGPIAYADLKTGAIINRPESSLLLFDKDRKVLWQAP
jgi:hypothetical protein